MFLNIFGTGTAFFFESYSFNLQSRSSTVLPAPTPVHLAHSPTPSHSGIRSSSPTPSSNMVSTRRNPNPGHEAGGDVSNDNHCEVVPCICDSIDAHPCKFCRRRTHAICQTAAYGVEGMEVGFYCGGTVCAKEVVAGDDVDNQSSDDDDRGGDDGDEGENAAGAAGAPSSPSSGDDGKCAAGSSCTEGGVQTTSKTRCCERPCHVLCASDCQHCNAGKIKDAKDMRFTSDIFEIFIQTSTPV